MAKFTTPQYYWYDNVFLPKVYAEIRKRTDNALWYEVQIDLEERADKWLEYAYHWTNLAVSRIARWAIARDKWYWSPTYVKKLNKAMASGMPADEALSSLL